MIYPFQYLKSSSIEIDINFIFSSVSFLAMLLNIGTSFKQGAYHVAQKSITKSWLLK
jgi:hypothetical protein